MLGRGRSGCWARACTTSAPMRKPIRNCCPSIATPEEMSVTDTWSPVQYNKFQREREQPLVDLLAMIRPAADMRVVDLGCGTGKPTRMLHARVDARETIGIDRSPQML